MTKVEAIVKIMQDNDGIASLGLIYANIERYYPNVKKPKEWQAAMRGVLYRDLYQNKTFKKLDNGLFSLIDFNAENYIKKNTVPTTERVSQIKIRIGQSFFRKLLLNNLVKCPFTNIKDNRLLIASHIKPWGKSDDVERLDMNNGFLFTPTYDLLFDKGYISFKNNKTLMVSKILDNKTQILLKLKSNTVITNLSITGREKYLEYHRDEVFDKHYI